jgi:hypothetical protein
VELARVLDACQASQSENWRVIPHDEPGSNLLAGLVDAGSNNERALTALHHNYRAVYLPDARLGLGWGWNAGVRPGEEQWPEWASRHWKRVELRLAHLLLAGTMVWRTYYTYVDQGAAQELLLPWPSMEYKPGADPLTYRPRPAGWHTTRWEVQFVRLLNRLNRNSEDDFERGLKGCELEVRESGPVDWAVD